MKILMKKVECEEERHSAAAAYINDALEVGRRGGMWDYMLLALKPWNAKLCIAPHETGIGVWLMCKESSKQSRVPPEELVRDLQMRIHRRHQTPKTCRQASVGYRKRVKGHRRAMHVIG